MKGHYLLLRLSLTVLIILGLNAKSLAQNRPNDQKPGSVLVFPYYTSNINFTADTLLSISNTGTTSVYVRLYFIEGISCWQADIAAFLTPNATLALKASEYVPIETGYLIAVAVDQNGNVEANGGLTGSAFVKTPAGYFVPGAGEVRGNYAATAFNAIVPIVPNNGELRLDFGLTLDGMPTSFAVSVQNPMQAIGQTIVLVGMNGSVIDGVISGGAMLGTGQAFSDSEVFRGYSSFIQGACQGFGTLTNSVPRIVTGNGLGLSGLILPGTIGLLKFPTAGGAGLLITPRNDGGWFGIRNLTITRTSNVTLKVPAY